MWYVERASLGRKSQETTVGKDESKLKNKPLLGCDLLQRSGLRAVRYGSEALT